MKLSKQNEITFSKNVAIFEENYWRSDEEEAVKFLKPGQLLIGGVGTGRTVGYLIKREFKITAIDISSEMLKKCKEQWPQVKAFVMDLQKTSFADDAFDSIFLPFHTIAYVDDIDITLREMKRILKPNGVLLFSVPNYWYIRAIIRGDIFKGKRHSTQITRCGKDTLSTIFMSMFDVKRVRRIFSSARVSGRVSLQHLENPNWKDRILMTAPLIDKSLYFFCKK